MSGRNEPGYASLTTANTAIYKKTSNIKQKMFQKLEMNFYRVIVILPLLCESLSGSNGNERLGGKLRDITGTQW